MNRIAEFREKAKLTQQQAADSAGWTQGRWSSYETEDRSPRPEVIKVIIETLAKHGVQTTFEELFYADVDVPADSPAVETSAA